MTSKQVAERLNVSWVLARKWARKNGVEIVHVGKRPQYEWSDQDIERFINRTDGRRKDGDVEV